VNVFRLPFRIGFPAALAGSAVLFFFGCVATGGGEFTETVGDYGYVGPWIYPAFEPDGYEGARPPYERLDDKKHEEPASGAAHAPGHEAGPGREPEPVHNNPRPPPSIPNRPRPAGGGGSIGGGGGAHPAGGGGSRGSGSSGRK
jgi:uncharacterized membrane protein YgcG